MAAKKSTPPDLHGLLHKFDHALAIIRTGVKALDPEQVGSEVVTILAGLSQLDEIYAELDRVAGRG